MRIEHGQVMDERTGKPRKATRAERLADQTKRARKHEGHRATKNAAVLRRQSDAELEAHVAAKVDGFATEARRVLDLRIVARHKGTARQLTRTALHSAEIGGAFERAGNRRQRRAAEKAIGIAARKIRGAAKAAAETGKALGAVLS
jgi:hypothetical protein